MPSGTEGPGGVLAWAGRDGVDGLRGDRAARSGRCPVRPVPGRPPAAGLAERPTAGRSSCRAARSRPPVRFGAGAVPPRRVPARLASAGLVPPLCCLGPLSRPDRPSGRGALLRPPDPSSRPVALRGPRGRSSRPRPERGELPERGDPDRAVAPLLRPVVPAGEVPWPRPARFPPRPLAAPLPPAPPRAAPRLPLPSGLSATFLPLYAVPSLPEHNPKVRGRFHWRRPLQGMSGGVLLSHAVPRAVPSALKGLTSGFGMGPGVSPSL